jgi:hypothetical protein
MTAERRRIAAFCPLCVSRCGCEAVVEDHINVSASLTSWRHAGRMGIDRYSAGENPGSVSEEN